MDTVAQGSTWSDVTTPIVNASGTVVADGLSGSPTVTLTTLRDALGVDRRTGASLSYDGDGGYRVTKPIPSDGARGSWWGVVTYNDGAGFVRTYSFGFTVVTAAQFDPVSALSAVTVTVTSPVALNGDVELYRGDAYADVDDRTITWPLENVTIDDLTDATVILYATHEDHPGVTLVAPGTVVTPTGDTRLITAELSSDQTIDLLDGSYRYSLVAELEGERPATLIAGTLTVQGGGRPVRRR